MTPTDEQKQRMRESLIGIGIRPTLIEERNKTLVYHVNNWLSRYGGYDNTCDLLEAAAKQRVFGYQPFYAFADKLSKQRMAEMRVIQDVEYHRINPEDPETKEWLRRRELGRTSPKDGQAAAGLGSRSVDRQDGSAGESVSGDGSGTIGEILRTGSGDGFKPAKERRK